ncbi:Hypothetical protein PHPALM_36593 [Phytophthora palmivora]|uniref:DUF6818 domain-containing protein n=1 Tax=Phytophthora palmivora TaxID=4796 RepID=A0A2P4WZJ6_9STRA|nr:Hypothetical protein PHPALM_36593 [Phytophthora palmivora]
MAGRGRRQGYGNYSLEQLLLCEVTEKIMLLGRVIWERVATKYNAKRSCNAPERDFESLRRKFKNLFKKSKPTGSGDVPLILRPVMWSKEIQGKLEAEGGAHTSHDGEALVQEVEQTTNSSTSLSRAKQKVRISQQGDISSLPSDDSLDTESDQGEVSSILNDEVATQPQPIGTTLERDDAISQKKVTAAHKIKPYADEKSVKSAWSWKGEIALSANKFVVKKQKTNVVVKTHEKLASN